MKIDDQNVYFNDTFSTIILKSTILDKNNKKISDFEKGFNEMMEEFFITNTFFYKTLVTITFEEIKSSSLNESTIEKIFNIFYRQVGQQIYYKIGNDKSNY
jgi:hypothetical protein